MTSALLLIIGCAPEEARDFYYQDEPRTRLDWLEDRWSIAVDVCQPPDPFVLTYRLGGTNTSEVCQAQIREDFGIWMDDFEEEGGSTVLKSVYEAAFVLMGRDMGSVASLSEDEPGTSTPEIEEKFGSYIAPKAHYVREPFIEDLELLSEELDREEVNALQYNLIAATIQNLRYVEEKTPEDHPLAAWYQDKDRTVFLTRQAEAGGVRMAEPLDPFSALLEQALMGQPGRLVSRLRCIDRFRGSSW